uniref:class I fructose-bisphosphate aldolase n=1 Tax=Salmonella sp. s54925 TaxID=3159674 RepID=UPI0039818859
QAWGGKKENVKAGHAELAKRAAANGAASCGLYTGIASLAGGKKTFEANYAY